MPRGSHHPVRAWLAPARSCQIHIPIINAPSCELVPSVENCDLGVICARLASPARGWIAQGRQMVAVVLKIFANAFRRIALVGIHQPEAGPVRILLADLLNNRSVAARYGAIAAQEYKYNHFAGIGAERINAATIKINCTLLGGGETRASQQRSRNDQSGSEFYP